MSKRKKKCRALQEAESVDSPEVLLLGEANFSFALALKSMLVPPTLSGSAGDADTDRRAAELSQRSLAVAAGYLGLPLQVCRQVRIVASCYETQFELSEKYPESAGILGRLTLFDSLEVRYQVNAWDLADTFGERQFDIIAWNHPHLGTEDFRLHRFLLAHFFHAKHLQPGGKVVLALLEGQETRWDLLEQAARHGFSLLSAPVPLAPASFPGYECKRNSTGRSFKNQHTQKTSNSSRSWVYHLGRQFSGTGGKARPKPETALEGASSSFRCDTCGKTFSGAQGLRTHVRQVHELKKYGEKPRGELQVTCDQCGRGFCDSEALYQHSLAAHSGDSAGHRRVRSTCLEGFAYRRCAICGMSLPLWMSRAAHQEALRPQVDCPYACGCGRSFVEQRALEQHERFCQAARRTWLSSLGGCCAKLCSQ
ncbi:unnamed protein product [Effrenium voratum]|uniref:C2H2-type domain-containing protein n=1 Tax=Effrenium voratum TaxID=2562239 RepID=A0AA36HZP7_9DINO|nr:unnamed protein product [Effrenium voratum]